MYNVDRLRELNSLLLVCGSDYSDVLLDAALEIERLRARVAELKEALRVIRRTAEESAKIMRNPERTEGWVGAERVARQFDRIATRAAIEGKEGE